MVSHRPVLPMPSANRYALAARRRRSAQPVCALALGASLAACNMTKLAATSTADVFHQAAPAFDEQLDYDFAKQAAPGSIMQLEGVLRVLPDNELLLFDACKSWTSYAFGFVEEEMEIAAERGDLQTADHQRARAQRMHLRARDLGRRLLERKSSGFQQAAQRGPDALRAFLAEHFRDRADAPALLFTGFAWGAAIDISRDDPALVADLPIARVLVERSVELDESCENANGLAFLRYVDASTSEAMGGHPEAGKKRFERALALTRHKALMVQMNFARSYAIEKQNRALFLALLQEVAKTGPDVNPSSRLTNEVARRRAVRLLRRVDELFDRSSTLSSSTKVARAHGGSP